MLDEKNYFSDLFHKFQIIRKEIKSLPRKQQSNKAACMYLLKKESLCGERIDGQPPIWTKQPKQRPRIP